MGWYIFEDKDVFDFWHNSIKQELGLPKLSIDSEGNQVEPMITDYTSLKESYGDGRLVAWVDDEYSQGLTATSAPESESLER